MGTKPISILITGDFCPINRIEELSKKGKFNAVFNDFITVFEGNDLNIVDLECPLTNSKVTRPKTGPYQKADPATIDTLCYAGVSTVAMANNHIMDYSTEGVIETLQLCEEKGITTIGIGSSLGEASKPLEKKIGGKSIAVFNFADNEFLNTPDGAYTCNPIDPIKGFYDINKARVENDFVIAIIHAGNEFYHLPSPRTKKLYRYLVDLGVDAVIGHHTHVFSGYEVYKGKPIFYGLGNFIYDSPQKVNSDWNRGFVVKLLLTNKVEFEIIPLKQGNEQPGVFKLAADEKVVFENNLNSLNQIIKNDEELEKAFQKYSESVFPMYDAFIEPYFGRFVVALQKRGFLPKLLSRKKRLFHLNLARCESHRDVLLRMLQKYE